MLGAASGPVCPSARCGGGGAAAWGQEEFIRGNNGAKGGDRPRSVLEAGQGLETTFLPSGFGLFLPNVTASQTGLGGDVGEANSCDLAKPGRHWRGPF